MKKITENPEKTEESTFDKVQDRRTFFLSISKAVLPGLALLGLGMATLSGCEKCDGCEATCADDCTSTCTGSCEATCADDCTSTCTGSCTGTCTGSCVGTCSDTCSGICKDDCENTCGNICHVTLFFSP